MRGSRWPIAITGFGAALLLVLGVEVVLISTTDLAVPGGYLGGVITAIPFHLGLLVGGYWLGRGGIPDHRHARIAKWCFGSALVTDALMVGLVILSLPPTLLLVVGTGRWAASVGGCVGLLIGIFEARAVERALQAEEFRRQREQTRRERDRLDEFAGVISHDLRNPLNVAWARVRRARKEFDSEDLAAIEAAIERMDRIVVDVLWLARAGRDIGTTEAVDLEAAADSAWSMVAEGAEGGRLRYVGDRSRPDALETDPDRFGQLMENLFSNAIRHGGRDVTVTVGTTADGFYVEDDGPGIPEEDREHVFEAGFTTDEEGNGLGLRIVKQVVDAHGWTVRVSDGGSRGARFEITGVQFVAE